MREEERRGERERVGFRGMLQNLNRAPGNPRHARQHDHTLHYHNGQETREHNKLY